MKKSPFCVLHKSKCCYLCSIPSCKMKKSMVFFRYKEERPKQRKKKQKQSKTKAKNQAKNQKQKGLFKDKAF